MPELRKNFIRPEGAPTYYVNNVEMRGTQFDFRFSLGEVTNVAADGSSIDIKHIADVYMSPQHAKSLLKLLGEQIRQYEEKVGTIVLVDDKPEK